MGTEKYPHLFEPIKIGNTVFRNRIFASPTGCQYLDYGNVPSAQGVAFYERKALGGAAAVTIGESIVDSRTGQAHAYQILLDNPQALPPLSSMATAISRHGAIASIQLQHCGMFSHYVYEQGGQLLGPVDTAIPDRHTTNNDGHEVALSPDGLRHVRGMTEEEIEHLITRYAKSAAFVKQCGFGMVMIHAGHGWGLAQFISKSLNTRNDKWGGEALENRMRLPLAVIDAVRRAVGPGFPIEVRISGAECTETGYDIDEGIEIAKMLDGRCDIIHVSAGHHESEYATTITHPSMFLEDGCNVKYAAEIKKHVRTPVATVGALVDPAQMEEIIASGKADIVNMGREFLADPDFPLKAMLGRDDDIDRCMRCCACFANSTRTRRRACAINPVIGHELEEQYETKPKTLKKVLVAGGGIAGMEAALTAARRGHSVILCEASDSLGGALRCEALVPFKKRLHEYLERQARRVADAGVEIRLNTPVTKELAEEIAPDAIIAALGATPVVPKFIKGWDCRNVFGAEYIYMHPEETGDRVVVLGGGLVGTELAIFLRGMGKDVTIIELMPTLNYGGNMVHAQALRAQINEKKIRLALSTRATEITDRGVVAEDSEGEKFFEADTVVYAVGQRPLTDEAFALRLCAPEFYAIGDCLAAKNILSATTAAYNAARDIGRI
ncbi:MAG: FAD-dependent oxidoreductase [Oscillospiraceae bacterium]|nr:FAD-dependent oxidoreductase [Oscillospiraceae bacterium]